MKINMKWRTFSLKMLARDRDTEAMMKPSHMTHGEFKWIRMARQLLAR